MKRLKYLIIMVIALLLSGSVFIACNNSLPTDHSFLLEDGYIYRVTYDGDGGDFQSSREVRMYFDSDDKLAADPAAATFLPTKNEQFVKEWFRRDVVVDPVTGDETVNEIVWNFSTDKFTKDIMEEVLDEATGITFYDLVLYPRWEYYLYIDYCISYVDATETEYLGTLTNTGAVINPEESRILTASSDTKKHEELPSYNGRQVMHSSGTAVPEAYDPFRHKNVRTSNEIMPQFYADAALTERISFPLDSKIAPKPLMGENRIRVFVKFFQEAYSIIASASEVVEFVDINYYLWRDVDFSTVDLHGNVTRKAVTAANTFENKRFIGNNYTISNLIINSNQKTAKNDSMGILGSFINSSISDVTFENCTVYYLMSENITSSCKLGLLAGTVTGSQSKINNVKMINTHGYVRSDKTSSIYNVSYGSTEGFLFHSKDQNVPSASIANNVCDATSVIKYFNVYINTPDTFNSDGSRIEGGFAVRNLHETGQTTAPNLLLEIGTFNAKLEAREAKPLFDKTGETSQYYITLNLVLTEIDGVMISFFDPIENRVYNAASTYGFTYNSTNKNYTLTIYVSEDTKAGTIAVKWNEDVTDEYKYNVYGGAGNVVAATGLVLQSGENVNISVDYYEQTVTYRSNSAMRYYVPTQASTTVRDRPEGHAIPLRLRLYARISDIDILNSNNNKTATYENITISIGDTLYDISDLLFTTQNLESARFHYVEFWMPLSREQSTRTITVNFYGRYSMIYTIKAAENQRFADRVTPAAASVTENAPSASPLALLPSIKSKYAI